MEAGARQHVEGSIPLLKGMFMLCKLNNHEILESTRMTKNKNMWRITWDPVKSHETNMWFVMWSTCGEAAGPDNMLLTFWTCYSDRRLSVWITSLWLRPDEVLWGTASPAHCRQHPHLWTLTCDQEVLTGCFICCPPLISAFMHKNSYILKPFNQLSKLRPVNLTVGN